MEFVYVLRSKKDGKLYVGLTNNVQRRLGQHNAGKITSTKSRRPFEIVSVEKFDDCIEAAAREKYFKSGIGRERLKKKIAGMAELVDALDSKSSLAYPR
jgi:putative endonuclease